MRTLLRFALLALVCCQAARAQDAKVDVFGGYSFLRPGNDPVYRAHDARHGWEVSGAYRPLRWLGVKVDASGHYGDESVPRSLFFPSDSPFSGDLEIRSRTHMLLFGPEVGAQIGPVRPFAHFLVGSARQRINRTLTVPAFEGSPFRASIEDTTTGLAVGGGVDVAVAEHVALRVVQADFLRADFEYGFEGTGFSDQDPFYFRANSSPDNLRLSFGLVFRF